MDISDSFPGGKAAGAWSWPLTSIQYRGQRMRGAIPTLPNTPSWRDTLPLQLFVKGTVFSLRYFIAQSTEVVILRGMRWITGHGQLERTGKTAAAYFKELIRQQAAGAGEKPHSVQPNTGRESNHVPRTSWLKLSWSRDNFSVFRSPQ
jgi:hypothetical protein